jgi:hypothetical protein
MSTIPALGKLRQEDFKFQPQLYSETLSQKKKNYRITAGSNY